MTKTLTKPETPGLPALVNTPALDIGSEDVALPRLYLGQFSSQAVKDQLIKPGAIYSASGQEDPEPVTLSDGSEPVVFHVLGLTKRKSYVDPDTKELTSFAFNDPDAPEKSYVTYNYILALPEVETDVPFKFLLKKTGANVARQINTVLKRQEARVPAHAIAFSLTAKKKQNPQGDYFVAVVRNEEAKTENIEVAANLSNMIAGASIEEESSTPADVPSI